MTRGYDAVKRCLDLAVGGVALVGSAPLQAVVAVLVARDLGRPVVFRQVRPGRHGKPFTLLKFRTMRDVDPRRGLVTDEQRLTRFGKALRATSLDELPSLWNVVVGDMSLVGPRPLLVEYLPLYSTRQARRHEVRPGLTGHAQVSGRNTVDWDERLELDVEYVEHRSLSLDLRIIWRTVGTVLRREGVSQQGQATMTRFTGSRPPEQGR